MGKPATIPRNNPAKPRKNRLNSFSMENKRKTRALMGFFVNSRFFNI
jgi:hypothetical protein